MAAIYGLIDPRTGELRYVGQTKDNLHKRLRRHVASRNWGETYVQSWIRALVV